MGNNDFRSVTSRDTYKLIPAALRFYLCYDHETAVVDRLSHSHLKMEHFQRNAATMAVPTSVISFDENTIRCKGRTLARTFMKTKPVKLGICFYTSVGGSLDTYILSPTFVLGSKAEFPRQSEIGLPFDN